MPRPDVLPPAPRPFVAELLLRAPLALDPAVVSEALARRGMRFGPNRRWASMPTGLRMEIGGGEIRVTARAEPVSAARLVTPMADAATWWEPDAVREHGHVLEVSVASFSASAAMTARLMARLTAALLDVAAEGHHEVLGVLVNGERLAPAPFIQAHATQEPSLGILVGMHVGEEGSDTAIRTSGLAALGLPDVRVATFDGYEHHVAELAGAVQQWARDMILTGAPATDEVSLGTLAAGRLVARRSAADFVVTVEPCASGEKPDNFEVVECPKCETRVETAIIQVGPIAMMPKCPACGEGPVALMARTLANLSGGEVEVTLESADPLAIAALLAAHDPRFASVVEATDYLRPRYDGLRVTMPMARTVAALLSAHAAAAGVRVSAPEALGVVERGASGELPTVNTPSGDGQMEAAMQEARRTVQRFLDRMANPEPGDEGFSIKVRVQDGAKVEHFWTRDVRREGIELVACLDATPRVVGNVREGQQVRVAIGEISDWAFANGGAMHGNYTLRAMLGSLPPAMQQALRGRLVATTA